MINHQSPGHALPQRPSERRQALTQYLEENPSLAKNIVTKGLRAAEAREAARKAREMVRAEKSATTGGLPEKLRERALVRSVRLQSDVGVEFKGVRWRSKASRSGIESEGWAERIAGKSP